MFQILLDHLKQKVIEKKKKKSSETTVFSEY